MQSKAIAYSSPQVTDKISKKNYETDSQKEKDRRKNTKKLVTHFGITTPTSGGRKSDEKNFTNRIKLQINAYLIVHK